MSVTQQEITKLRAQLAEDRKLCANSELAQAYLNSAEAKLNDVEASWARQNPVEALDAVLDTVEIGSETADSADSAELRAMVADLREWEAALEDVSANRTLPLYILAEKYLRTLKQNYVALYLKHEAQTLPAPEHSTVN